MLDAARLNMIAPELRGAWISGCRGVLLRRINKPGTRREWDRGDGLRRSRINHSHQQSSSSSLSSSSPSSSSGMLDLDVLALKRLYSYSGHIARQSKLESGLLLSRVLVWNCHAAASSNVRRSGDRQGFCTRFCPWHWENQLVRFFRTHDLNWMEVAMDKQRWRSFESSWLAFRLGESGRSAVR